MNFRGLGIPYSYRSIFRISTSTYAPFVCQAYLRCYPFAASHLPLKATSRDRQGHSASSADGSSERMPRSPGMISFCEGVLKTNEGCLLLIELYSVGIPRMKASAWCT